MGIVTHIDTEYYEDEDYFEVKCRTKMGVNDLTSINRVATRVSAYTNVSQRALVAAAAEAGAVDIVWKEGPFQRSPEKAFPEAQEIEYKSYEVDEDSSGFPLKFAPEYMHVWKIPMKFSRSD